MRDSSKQRREFLKGAGTLGIAGFIAGCTGGGGDGGGGDGGDGGGGATTTAEPTTTEPPTTTTEMSEEEQMAQWREEASEKAAAELEGDEKLVFTTKIRSEEFRQALTTGFEGVYAPLEGKIDVVPTDMPPQIQRYVREIQSGRETTTMDLLDFATPFLPPEIPLGDISGVPGFILAPDDVKYGKVRGAVNRAARGLAYNTELVSDPPENFQDLLEPRFADRKILVDITSASIAPMMLEFLGEDYLRALGEQEPQFTRSGFGLSRSVAQGDAHVALFAISNHVVRFGNEGQPIEPVRNPDGWWWRSGMLQMSAKPKHPWAAKLFIDRNMRPEAAEIQASRPGTVSLDRSIANPEWLKDVLNPERTFTFNPNRWEMDFNEADARVRELIGAPSI